VPRIVATRLSREEPSQWLRMPRVRALHLYDLQNEEASCINFFRFVRNVGGDGESTSRRGGGIRFFDGPREAEPGEELPEEDWIIVCATDKAAELRLALRWPGHADINPRSMMTDRRATPVSRTGRVHTSR